MTSDDTRRAPPWLGDVRMRLALAVLAFPLANAVLNVLILKTPVPLFLDSSFTAASALFGLPYGMATAVMTNLLEEAFNGFPWKHLPFAICGMATVLIVWFMARLGKLRTPLHALLATFFVALANSVLGAVIATFVYGGGTGTNIDIVVAGFSLAMESIFSAAFFGRMLVNIVDKAPAVILAMVMARFLGVSGASLKDR
mgnify:FL=1